MSLEITALHTGKEKLDGTCLACDILKIVNVKVEVKLL